MTEIMKGVYEYTGLSCFAVFGGPIPMYEGDLRTLTVAYGRNQEPSPCHFPQWAKARFGQDVLEFMREWLRTAYTPAQCAEAAMPANEDEDGDPLARARYRIDQLDDWGGKGDEEDDSESDSDDSSDSESDSESGSGSDDSSDSGVESAVVEGKKKKAKKAEVRKARAKASDRAKAKAKAAGPSRASKKAAAPARAKSGDGGKDKGKGKEKAVPEGEARKTKKAQKSDGEGSEGIRGVPRKERMGGR
ncbi:hypothetical protein R3P38DRAFT_2782571 [Favolaschia claudopus]|uniref:Uncharacterized protein n=1 Tax=Favolaschia claudopus TaxID=2862362 RepID=A0AAW0B4A4_9AGAR